MEQQQQQQQPAYQYDLVLCSIFQNEAAWLREWLEFHLLVGVQHALLYNNHSTDAYGEVVDTDEFVFSPREPDLREVLRAYDQPHVGAVCVNWLMFGTSHAQHVPPQCLLVETLVRRAPLYHAENLHVKSFVRPERVTHLPNRHFAALRAGYVQVNTAGEPFSGPFSPYVDVSVLRARITTGRVPRPICR